MNLLFLDNYMVNLKSLAKVAVLKSLWDKLAEDTILKLYKNHDSPVGLNPEEKSNVFRVAIERAESLDLPCNVFDEIRFSCVVMCPKILDWILTFHERFGVWFDGEIFWTPFGSIDEGKTVQIYLENSNLLNNAMQQELDKNSMAKLLLIPCVYPNEAFIKANIGYMLNISKDCWHSIYPPQDDDDDEKCVWALIINAIYNLSENKDLFFNFGDFNILDRLMHTCRIGFFCNYNEVLKFYLKKLESEDKRNMIVSLFWYWGLRIRTHDAWFDEDNLNFEILFVMLNLFKYLPCTESESVRLQCIVFKLTVILKNHPYYFLSALSKSWDLLTDADFKAIMRSLAIRITNFKMINYSNICLNYYLTMAQKIWMKFTKEQKLNLYHTFWDSIFRNSSLEQWGGLSFLEFIFNDIDLKSERKNLCRKAAKIIAKSLSGSGFNHVADVDVSEIENAYGIFIFPEEKNFFQEYLVGSIRVNIVLNFGMFL